MRQDIQYALRGFRRSPTFAATVVLTIAVAIGATTAVFSLADALMFRELPVAHADQLVAFRQYIGAQSLTNDMFPWQEYERFRNLAAFSDVAAEAMLDRSNVTLSGSGGGLDPAQARVALVSGNYFRLYDARAERGRMLSPDDDRVPSGHPVVVLSHRYWMRRLGGAADVLTRTLSLNGTVYTIIGVIDPSFTGDWVGRPVDIWAPTMMQAEMMAGAPGYLRDRGPWPSAWERVIGRLTPGASRAAAQAAAGVVHAQMLKEWEGPNPDARQLAYDASQRLRLEPAARGYSPMRESFGSSLGILAALVGLVLAIACANVAGIVLVRATAHDHDFSLRLALGASQARIVRQLVTECMVLAIVGGAIGLLFATWCAGTLAELATSGPVKMDWGASSWSTFDLGLTGRSLAYAVLVCSVTTALVGLAPALRIWTLAPGVSGVRGAGASVSPTRFRLGRALVITQVAVSLVLLVGAGLLARSLENLRSRDLGLDRRHLLFAWVQAGATGRSPLALRLLYHATQQRLALVPGVAAVAVTGSGPLGGELRPNSAARYVRVRGQQPDTRGPAAFESFVTPGYFAALGIRILAGRDLSELDTDSTQRVAIVNESFAKFHFRTANPVGQQFRHGWDGDSLSTIVGVVGDQVEGSPRERPGALGFVYRPYRDRRSGFNLAGMTVAVRAQGDPRLLVGRVGAALRAVDPTMPILKIDTVDEQLNDVIAPDRLLAGLAGFFGLVAMFLAALGLYGLTAYTTARRTSEIGIRMALGATNGAVLTMILSESLALVGVGLAVGAAGAAGATRVMAARLFDLSARDPTTIAGAVVVMIGVGALAALIPSLRAARVDPMVALRV